MKNFRTTKDCYVYANVEGRIHAAFPSRNNEMGLIDVVEVNPIDYPSFTIGTYTAEEYLAELECVNWFERGSAEVYLIDEIKALIPSKNEGVKFNEREGLDVYDL